jgi:hypothetical protein
MEKIQRENEVYMKKRKVEWERQNPDEWEKKEIEREKKKTEELEKWWAEYESGETCCEFVRSAPSTLERP